VQVKVDDFKMFRTTNAKYTFNPVWNEWREFKTYRSDQISFSIVDEKEKSVLAECHMSLDNLVTRQIEGEPMQLKEPLTPIGDLHLEITL
jgi:Ca2+-dependent lipid-binding protein